MTDELDALYPVDPTDEPVDEGNNDTAGTPTDGDDPDEDQPAGGGEG